jgi:GNAT superfamily N-acetyltransferase
MQLTSFTPHHARQVAEIHAEGQAGTFLTQLGLDFLAALYTAMATSPWCFGFALVESTTVAGIGVAALDTDRLFRDVKRRHWHRLLWPVLRQVARQPSLVGGIIQSIRYPIKLAAPPDQAEILFLGLRRSYMRQGLAPRLVDRLLDEAYRRGCTSATAIIDRRNRPIRWTIATLPGIYVDREISMNGKTMLVYRAQLPLEGQESGKDTQPLRART